MVKMDAKRLERIRAAALEKPTGLAGSAVHEIFAHIDQQQAEIACLEKGKQEFARIIARNLVAWDTSKDKREGLLPEVYLTNKVLYKQLTGEEYFKHKAMKKFQIGDDYS